MRTHSRAWIRGIPGHTRIADVLLPGTLDSAISVFDPNLRLSYCKDERAARILQVCRGWAAAEHVIAFTARRQRLSVYNQLAMGIRFLDIKLTYDVLTEEVYCSNTFLSTPFRNAAAEITRFLGDPLHAGEFVVMRMGLDPATKLLMRPSAARSMLSRDADVAPFFDLAFSSDEEGGLAASLRTATVGDARGRVIVLCDEDVGECLPSRMHRYPAEEVFFSSRNSEQDAETSMARQLEHMSEADQRIHHVGGGFVMLVATIALDPQSVAFALTRHLLTTAGLFVLIVSMLQRSKRMRNAAILGLALLAIASAAYPETSTSLEADSEGFQRYVSELLKSERFPRSVNIVASNFATEDFVVAVIESNARLRGFTADGRGV